MGFLSGLMGSGAAGAGATGAAAPMTGAGAVAAPMSGVGASVPAAGGGAAAGSAPSGNPLSGLLDAAKQRFSSGGGQPPGPTAAPSISQKMPDAKQDQPPSSLNDMQKDQAVQAENADAQKRAMAAQSAWSSYRPI